jgi:hypothetical protein
VPQTIWGWDYWLCGVRRFTNHKGPE